MNPDSIRSSGAPATVSVDGGSVKYWGSLDGTVTPHVWTLTATSTSQPKGPGFADAQRDGAVRASWQRRRSEHRDASVSLSNVTKFQGAIYTAGGFRIENATSMQGPVGREV